MRRSVSLSLEFIGLFDPHEIFLIYSLSLYKLNVLHDTNEKATHTLEIKTLQDMNIIVLKSELHFDLNQLSLVQCWLLAPLISSLQHQIYPGLSSF